MEGERVVGQPWVIICRKWWTTFSAMYVFAWQTRWFTGGDLKRLREYSVAMGQAHIQLGVTFVVPLVDRPPVFFCSAVANPLQICIFYNGGQPTASEARVAQ